MVQKNCITKPKVIAIVGPTASGKTSVGVNLAKEFNGEIISADSMQIYKAMDIGTAKVTKDEMEGIPHHLIDVVEPTESFSVAMWVDLAKEKIAEIISRGKTPIIVGGTGLYVTSLLEGYTFYNVKENTELRERYNELLEKEGEDSLYNLLKEKDPKKALSIDKSKHKAIIRALEIIDGSTEIEANSKATEKPYSYLLIGLNHDRETLYGRINQRVEKMVDAGLFKEFINLILNYDLKPTHQSAGAIGYKELFPLLDGKETEDRTIELIKQHSRNYAKRQLTWMKKMDGIIWLSPKTQEEEIRTRVREFLGE